MGDLLRIIFNKKPKDLYFSFREAVQGHRFDGIAGALQKFLEDMLCQWVQACVQQLGVRRICFAGGVDQNIRACYYAMWQYLLANHWSIDRIIKSFEKLTGVGAVLNTSFNLHGHPVVLGPKEAIYTFENSQLDALVMENFLIMRS